MYYRGLELVAGVLFFEGVEVVDLSTTKLTASQRAGFEATICAIDGLPEDEIWDAMKAACANDEEEGDD